MAIAPIIPLVAAAVSTAGQMYTNNQNRKLQQNENEIIRSREDNATSRAVQDIKRAGLNPVTDSAPSAAASPTTAPQISSPTENSSNVFSSLYGTLAQIDSAQEMNEENNAISFAQNWSNQLYKDVQDIDGLIEQADNDFKGQTETMDEDSKDFFAQVNQEKKNLSSWEKVVSKDTTLKTLLETLDKDSTFWKVDAGTLHIDAEALKNRFGIETTQELQAGLSKLGLNYNGSYHGSYNREKDVSTQDQRSLNVGNTKDIEKDTTRSATDETTERNTHSWRGGLEKLITEIAYQKVQNTSSIKITETDNYTYSKYLELRSHLLSRRQNSYDKLENYRSDFNGFIGKFKTFLHNFKN